MTQPTIIACLSAALVFAGNTQTEKIAGYAEFRRGDTVMVDGQRVLAASTTTVKGAKGLAAIPLGYEVKVTGHRNAAGVLIAERIEAKANGSSDTERQIIAASNQAESAWVSKHMMFEPADSGKIVKIGDILESGPYVTRARRIMDRLRPSYIPATALRVRAVKTDQWNASAMANGAIWVFTGLMDSLSDDEMAIVLGHELTHYTHEHMRRQMSKGTLGQILGTGAAIAVSQIKNSTAQQIAAFGGQMGLSALMTGYSREHEDQADRVGLRYAYESGFDPTKGPGLWEKFKQKYGESDKITNFFTGDHSRPTERIKNLRHQIQLNYMTPRNKT
ncbi:MAG TPA: M48 family metalloprotease [Gemmatimonadales bacterium]